ncbi:MAG: hypothetical protein ACTHJV_11530 [Rhizobiaceae bacterium]
MAVKLLFRIVIQVEQVGRVSQERAAKKTRASEEGRHLSFERRGETQKSALLSVIASRAAPLAVPCLCRVVEADLRQGRIFSKSIDDVGRQRTLEKPIVLEMEHDFGRGRAPVSLYGRGKVRRFGKVYDRVFPVGANEIDAVSFFVHRSENRIDIDDEAADLEIPEQIPVEGFERRRQEIGPSGGCDTNVYRYEFPENGIVIRLRNEAMLCGKHNAVHGGDFNFARKGSPALARGSAA